MAYNPDNAYDDSQDEEPEYYYEWDWDSDDRCSRKYWFRREDADDKR